MKIVAIIQARMGSTRLPGKILKEVLGRPLLEYQIERVRKSRFIHQIVIATTNKESEQPIIDLCNRLSVAYHRGSEQDVLLRYWEAAMRYKATVVVRLTSDCPLIDPKIIDASITKYLSKINLYDYVSNTIERTFPRGLDVEVMSMKALDQANREARNIVHREHVTPYIYLHPDKFTLGSVKNPLDVSSYRLTVDTKEDFQLIKRLIHYFSDKKIESVTFEDIICLLQKKPEWNLINSHIEQKKLEDII
ncbi:cytidylyltransferase domain-containing protein [Shimazuella alba]|uniref:NTP transferase domain-containing protein n=1 Tax=Shimazuella alba TaxID=2690964 RepID=A0A6I4VVW4_9BACL|nr:glycosyltransferase family protein [Shimazuella alba]MXQ54255.1 NTP transferase domain-containing protein [Shimazuella alba]